MLLAGIAHLTEHANQSRLYLTITHASNDKIKSMVSNVRNGVDHIRQTAPQLAKIDARKVMLNYIIEKNIGMRAKNADSTNISTR